MTLSPTKVQGACRSASNIVDMKEFTVLWSQCDWRGVQYVVADKGYDYSAVKHQITASGKTPVSLVEKGYLSRCSG